MTTPFKTTLFTVPHPSRVTLTTLTTTRPICLSLRHKAFTSLRFSSAPSSFRFVKFVASTSREETQTQTQIENDEEEIEDSSDGASGMEDSSGGKDDIATSEEAIDATSGVKEDIAASGEVTDASSGVKEDTTTSEEAMNAENVKSSAILVSLQSYKDALSNDDKSKIAEVEAFLKSIEDDKVNLEGEVSSLTAELTTEKVTFIRISAEFDNFRKRTDKERLSLVTEAQAEVIENLLPVLDNFESSRAQIKVETEGEEKISSSYQSIYKQFIEILSALKIDEVETEGNALDPLARYQPGSKFRQFFDGPLRKVDQVFSGFMKSWIRF